MTRADYIRILARERSIPIVGEDGKKGRYVLDIITGRKPWPTADKQGAIIDWLKGLDKKNGRRPERVAPRVLRGNVPDRDTSEYTGRAQVAYARLDGGQWGVRVATKGARPLPGQTVIVRKASGQEKRERLGSLVMQDMGAFPAPAYYYFIAR